MPNNIANRLYASSEVLDSLRLDDKGVDFNTVIAMPKIIDSGPAPSHIEGFAESAFFRKPYTYYPDIKGAQDFSDEEFELFLRYLRALKEEDCMNWNDWSRANWGTKWNAYEIRRDENYVEFQTAWNAPLPVYEALSKKYPEEKIKFEWACEFMGEYAGIGHCLAGNPYIHEYKNESRMAYETYLKVWNNGELGNEFKWVGDELVYVGE